VSARPPFRPWAAQRRKGFVLTAAGTAGLAGSLYAPPDWTLPCVVAGLAASLVGLAWLKRAKARAHGQGVEAKHLPLAARQLEEAGFDAERNVKIGRADVDLVVKNLGQIAAIEVKSFGYWRSRLRDRARERSARAQALRQKERLGARAAVLWLPHAQHTWLSRLLDFWFPERDVTVVRGPARHLVRHLKNLMKP
jgi:Holliday junction resolvase-like predicted endonuclease